MKDYPIVVVTGVILFFNGLTVESKNITEESFEVEEVENDTFFEDIDSLKNSIKQCVIAVEESKRVIELNKGYLKNLDSKLQKIERNENSNSNWSHSK